MTKQSLQHWNAIACRFAIVLSDVSIFNALRISALIYFRIDIVLFFQSTFVLEQRTSLRVSSYKNQQRYCHRSDSYHLLIVDLCDSSLHGFVQTSVARSCTSDQIFLKTVHYFEESMVYLGFPSGHTSPICSVLFVPVKVLSFVRFFLTSASWIRLTMIALS